MQQFRLDHPLKYK